MLKENIKKINISSFTLHIIAMVTMLIDHLYKFVFHTSGGIAELGRLSFPIFAFMIVEGYFHTKNYNKYLLRIFIFACLSEIPFNLMISRNISFNYSQNVLWTFLIGLICIRIIDLVKNKNNKVLYVIVSIVVSFIGYKIGFLCGVDYRKLGVLTVLTFYFLRERTVLNMFLEVIILLFININLTTSTAFFTIPLFGSIYRMPKQALAIFSLIPIWLYKGRQGYHSKVFKYACYAFYPVHMLLIYFYYLYSL